MFEASDPEPELNPLPPRSGGRDRRRPSRSVIALAGALAGILVVSAIALVLALRAGPSPSGSLPQPVATSAPDAAGVPSSSATVPIANVSAPTAQPRTGPPARPLAIPTVQLAKDQPQLAPVRKADTPDPDPSTDHVIVVDGDSGAILFQRNAYEAVAPASLTKIMTAILGIEHGTLTDHVVANVDARSFSDSTVMGLEPWFDVTLEDILYGLMLPSGNDAAVAIARYVAGTDDNFVSLMNEKARWLGLKSTHFANPHGLDDPNHYSSPYDMVVMARYGMQYPEFRKLAAARSYDIRESNISYTIENLNPLLYYYQGADGVKIGYTDNAGRSIVASAVRNGHRIYVAYMKSADGLVPETSALLDWAFNSFTWQ